MKKIFYESYQKFYYGLIKRNSTYLSSSKRSLPNFIICGTVRSGTTSLFNYLGQHPSIILASQDEIGFFDSNYHLGLNWYRSFFPLKKELVNLKKKTGFALTGEDTPFYFWKPQSIQRIKRHIPNCKFLSIFRNPVDRAYSNYQLAVRTGNENMTFEDAIDCELKILKNSLNNENFLKNGTINENRSYLSKSLYKYQLKNWLSFFEPSQFFFLSTEELSENSRYLFNNIFNFLEIPNFEISTSYLHKSEKYPPIDEETRLFLNDFFLNYNEDFFKMIGKRFNWND